MGEGDEDLDEKLDRDRHGSGEFDPEERYGRRGVDPDRSKRVPGDDDDPDDDVRNEDVRNEDVGNEDAGAEDDDGGSDEA